MKKSIPLKEIVGFLPYGLKCYAQGVSTADTEFDEYPKPQEFEIVGLDVEYVSIYEESRTVTEEMEYCDIIPCVRPLSDLTKEITHNGETFVPIRKFYDMRHVSDAELKPWLDEIIRELKNDNPFKLSQFQQLYEWHFDIYDWIKDGLAIDINTLNQ